MNKSIDVELSTFHIAVLEDGQTVRTITDFAIGRPGHLTPINPNSRLSPTKRERDHVSSIYPPPNGGAHMPFALFFDYDPAVAFHQGDTSIASHGCIHLSESNARWLFDWAGADVVGLSVRGPYPPEPTAPKPTYKQGGENMVSATIIAIQTQLIAAGYLVGPASGAFDGNTDEAVRAFQTSKGLVIDGVVGLNTAAALGVAI